jgi:hypothetical protein
MLHPEILEQIALYLDIKSFLAFNSVSKTLLVPIPRHLVQSLLDKNKLTPAVLRIDTEIETLNPTESIPMEVEEENSTDELRGETLPHQPPPTQYSHTVISLTRLGSLILSRIHSHSFMSLFESACRRAIQFRDWNLFHLLIHGCFPPTNTINTTTEQNIQQNIEHDTRYIIDNWTDRTDTTFWNTLKENACKTNICFRDHILLKESATRALDSFVNAYLQHPSTYDPNNVGYITSSNDYLLLNYIVKYSSWEVLNVVVGDDRFGWDCYCRFREYLGGQFSQQQHQQRRQPLITVHDDDDDNEQDSDDEHEGESDDDEHIEPIRQVTHFTFLGHTATADSMEVLENLIIRKHFG